MEDYNIEIEQDVYSFDYDEVHNEEYIGKDPENDK